MKDITINICQLRPEDYPIEYEAWLAWQSIKNKQNGDFATFMDVFKRSREFILKQENNNE